MTIFWFRRDLRIDDNKGFFEALKSGSEVLPIFIFDKNILGELPKDDARVSFIHELLDKIDTKLQKFGNNFSY
jgi:deoxyribodipyrimidine photo-lyase